MKFGTNTMLAMAGAVLIGVTACANDHASPGPK